MRKPIDLLAPWPDMTEAKGREGDASPARPEAPRPGAEAAEPAPLKLEDMRALVQGLKARNAQARNAPDREKARSRATVRRVLDKILDQDEDPWKT